MRYRHIILILLFSIIISVQTQAAQRKIVFVKEWEEAQVNPVFDKMYDTVVKEFTLNDSFKVVDNKEFETRSGVVLTSIFADVLDPLLLSEINIKLQVNIVMLLSIQQESLYINTLEFPSGITIDKFIIDRSELNNPNPEAMIKYQLGGLIELLNNSYTIYGYPFHNNEYGVVIITDNPQSTIVKENLSRLMQYYSRTVLSVRSKPLRLKIMINNFECEQGSQICTMTSANFALKFAPDSTGIMDYRLTLVFPYIENNKPYINIELPYLAGNEQLVCYEFAGENPNMEQLGGMIFTDKIDYKQLDIVPVFLHKLLYIHKQWASKIPNANIDPDHINDYYILLYNQLPQNSLASAWVGLNYAGYYLQTGQYVMAGPLFNKAYRIFTEHSIASGMILSLLGTAHTASMLKNYPVAKQAFENVLKVYNIKDDSITVAAVNYNLGLIAELINSAKTAINYYESSAYLYNKINEKYKAMQIYQRIAQLLADSGQIEKSVDYFNLYLKRAQELHSEPDIALAQFNLGLAGYDDNNNQEAFQHLQNAKSYYEMLGDQNDNMVIIDMKLGIIHFKNREYTEAQKYLYATLDKVDKVAPVDNIFELYRYLGDLETVFQNWPDAHKYYDRGLDSATQAKSQPKMAEFIYRKGLSHLKQGQVDLGYSEVKKGIELSDGAVHGGRKTANEFLKKLAIALKK